MTAAGSGLIARLREHQDADRHPIYPDTISVRFRALRERVGVDHVELRQFRHDTATQLLATGMTSAR